MGELLIALAPDVATWVLGFVVHGSLLLGAVWLISRFWRGMPLPVSEVLWKFALVAPFVTSSLQLALGAPLVVARLPGGGAALRLPPAEAPVTMPSVDAAWLDTVPAAAEPATTLPLVAWLALLVVVLGGLGMVPWLLEHVRVRRLLRDRRPLADPAPRARLERLRRRANYRRAVRLSQSPEVQAPIAFGVLRPEICVPEGLLARLDAAQTDAMLAHELAHLEAQDPLWLALLALCVRLFWWHPLLRLGRHALREIAEFRSDDRAAELTAEQSVAGCLVAVAGWMLERRGTAAPALASMALEGTVLRQRVDRLLARAPRRRSCRRLIAPVTLVLLGAATAALPGATLERSTQQTRPAARASETPVLLLVEELAALDRDCAALAEEFTALQRELATVGSVDAATHALLAALAQRLDQLDTRRGELRRQVLIALVTSRMRATQETPSLRTREEPKEIR